MRRTAQKRYRERQVGMLVSTFASPESYATFCPLQAIAWRPSLSTFLPLLCKAQKEKMHDFERQVEQLSEQVSILMREKASLETRNSLLERVVQLKDEQNHSTSHEVGVGTQYPLCLHQGVHPPSTYLHLLLGFASHMQQCRSLLLRCPES